MSAQHVLRCQCGQVECTVDGDPISTAVCYCDDCQAAAKQIEALDGPGGGPPVADEDGGTALSLVRKDRFSRSKGAQFLQPHKLKPDSVTNRYVASCCNSAMFIGFDKGPFWVSAMRNRFVDITPPVAMRLQTKYRTSNLPYPDNAPTYATFPKAFAARLMWEWVKMKVGR